MLDMLTPLITEADTVEDDILQVIFMHVTEPNKVSLFFVICTFIV